MVRTIAMDSSDGLSRGAEVKATDNPIQMPIGKEINGRLFNVIGLEIYQSQVIVEFQFTENPLSLKTYLHQLKYFLQNWFIWWSWCW